MAENPVDNMEQRVVKIKDFFDRFGLPRTVSQIKLYHKRSEAERFL